VLTLIRALWKDASRCTRCGSPDFYPDPGPLGALLHLVRLSRHRCRDCRTNFWLRSDVRPEPQRSLVAVPDPDAAAPGTPPGDADGPDPATLDAAFARPAAGPAAEASLTSLDAPTTPAAVAVVDLSALDAEIERLRSDGRQPSAAEKAALRGRRGVGPGPGSAA
jgi:hypothetical protein